MGVIRTLRNTMIQLGRLPDKLALKRKRPGFFSPYGGLWTDRVDADDLIDARLTGGELDEEDARLLRDWRRDGFVILRDAVPHDVVDAIAREVDDVWERLDENVKIELGGTLYGLEPERRAMPFKIVDQYAWSEQALAAAFAPRIRDFLRLVFERDVLLFQSLTFERGSRQPIHQDSAYVVVTSPMELAASWIALEDVQPGSGELEYYKGSHRIKPFLFRNGYRNWNRERDGDEMHERYLESLHVRAQELGLERESFLPRKGDALIWSADLAHGGGEVRDETLTRKSFVSHYCPNDMTPYFFTYSPEHRTQRNWKGGGKYCSSHYEL